jgi:acetoin utilization protein AcuB
MIEARNVMTKKIIKVHPEMPIQGAYEEMKENAIRHLPVVDHTGKLVGILSDRDIQRAIHVTKINEIEQEMTFNPHDTVENFMSWPVQTVNENTSILELTKMMIELKVSAFVVNGPNQYVKGIITTEDLLKYLLELIGTSEHSKGIPISQLHWVHI